MSLTSTTVRSSFQDRSVFITGHTGFKGSWLTQWLVRLGANVTGYALDPQPHEILYGQLELSEQLEKDHRADVRDKFRLQEAVSNCNPDFIFHLAAQPLVRKSFDEPALTFETNVMGTVNVLDAARVLDRPCAVVVVTTDKCYENREWVHSYREEDPMGGHDPYSASKGCAELVTSSYRRSFCGADGEIAIASARAGNVVGGGDWAIDRIVPDVFRSLFSGKPVRVRNRYATRPWQHVLEPLSGYLWLAACLDSPRLSLVQKADLCSAFNFGPGLTSNRTVCEVVESFLAEVGGEWVDGTDPGASHEASRLNLAIDKAFHHLAWAPTWGFKDTIHRTAAWYRSVQQGECPIETTVGQICDFELAAVDSRQAWAATPSEITKYLSEN